MAVFIVSHSSALVAYAIATSLLWYYRNKLREVRIVIVESHPRSLGGIESAELVPWCGVSTISNKRYINSTFINGLAQHILSAEKGVIQLEKVKSIESDNTSSYRPNGNALQSWISMRRDKAIGLIYLPIQLTNGLRAELLQTGKVLFTSLHRVGSLDELAYQMQGEETVILDFVTAMQHYFHNQHQRDNFLVHSNLSNVQYYTAQGNQPSLPNTVLWLPRFRSLTNATNEPSYTLQLSRTPSNTQAKIHHCSIYTPAVDPTYNNITSKLDVFSSLSAADYSIQLTMDVLARSQFLSVL